MKQNNYQVFFRFKFYNYKYILLYRDLTNDIIILMGIYIDNTIDTSNCNKTKIKLRCN